MTDTILVALDGSLVSKAALPFGDWIARATRSDLLLVTVVPELESGSDEHASARAREILEGLAARMQVPGLTVRTAVLTGAPDRELVRLAALEAAQLVLLTTFGKSGDARHLGGTASRLSRDLQQPALFIPPTSDFQPPISGPLFVALDGSELAESTLPPALDLARALGLTVTLVRVAPWAAQLFAATLGLAPPGADTEIELGSNVYLAGVAERLSDNGSIDYQTLRGHPAGVLVDYAHAAGGMLALSSHGHSGFHLWSLGSTTDKVLRAAAVPVLLVPARGRTAAPEQAERSASVADRGVTE